ncbi:MAG: hypothetical protein JJE35_14930 [Thermoleophilia bacterium]|nr:hypothetical protein [Thermoleophilia bacterium]
MVKVFAGSVRPDSVGVEFDDERLIANAGLVLVATLSIRLGIESLVDKTLRVGQRAGAAQPGRKVLSLIHAIAAGGGRGPRRQAPGDRHRLLRGRGEGGTLLEAALRLAHNMVRWIGQLGLRDSTWRTARTIRRWLIALPGRLTRTARPFHPPPPGPLALAGGLRRGAEQDQGAAGRSLTSLYRLLLTRRIARPPWAARHRPLDAAERLPPLLKCAGRTYSRWFSPLTGSRTAIPLSVMVNRWIEA